VKAAAESVADPDMAATGGSENNDESDNYPEALTEARFDVDDNEDVDEDLGTEAEFDELDTEPVPEDDDSVTSPPETDPFTDPEAPVDDPEPAAARQKLVHVQKFPTIPFGKDVHHQPPAPACKKWGCTCKVF
jgi:hypothetical protein